jgi:hypothetical protein
LNGTPLVDAPTSWQYLTWKYQYNLDQEPTEPALDDHLLIVRALQSINDDDRLRVLRASPDVLINLRRNGVLGDLREMLRTGIHNIESAAPSDVEGVTTAIAAAFGSAMQGHQKKLDELVNAGIRWYGLKLAPMVVSASISILGAATGNIPMATIGAVTSALGAPTAKDVLKDGKRIIAGYRRLRRSAAGILFRNV